MVTNNKDKLNEYNKVDINTANQEALILKCYNGVLNCLKTAKGLIPDRKKWPEAHKHLIKAEQGLGLLADSVNTKTGEIGENLVKLYDFMIRYTIKANQKKDIGMIDEVISMLADMKESWEKAFEKLHQEAGVKKTNPNPVPNNSLNIIG